MPRLKAMGAILAAGLLAACAAAGAFAGEGKESANPLSPFEKLIGGRWWLEGSYQEFEWGVGRRSVVARSFFVVDGRPKKVSEGFWYWHPGEKVIRGVFVAIDMPVELFDYTTKFEGSKMVSELRSFTGSGEEKAYTEIFEFTGADAYEWSLYSGSHEARKKEMGGAYTRKP